MAELKGRVHSIETFGTMDGPGIRYIVFMQGCPLRCSYCHNPDSWRLDSGSEMSVSEIVTDIERYVPFIESSGGGVTISGGEPTLQMEFLKELVSSVKKLGVHVCLDTSGYVDTGKVDEILESIDLVILDIKHMDREKHMELTGVDNEKILSFASHLSKRRINTWIRHVLVPGITDSPEHLQKMSEFISTLESVTKVELLPYHSMGKYKWELLGCKYKLEGTREATREDILKAEDIIRR
jgi:pyruvate formate lyase activating enzyme